MQLPPPTPDLVSDWAELCTPTPVLSYFPFPKSSPFPGTGSDRCCHLHRGCSTDGGWKSPFSLPSLWWVSTFLRFSFSLDYENGFEFLLPTERKNTHWVESCSQSSLIPWSHCHRLFQQLLSFFFFAFLCFRFMVLSFFWCVLHPGSRFFLIWGLVSVFANLVYFWLASLRLGFSLYKVGLF